MRWSVCVVLVTMQTTLVGNTGVRCSHIHENLSPTGILLWRWGDSTLIEDVCFMHVGLNLEHFFSSWYIYNLWFCGYFFTCRFWVVFSKEIDYKNVCGKCTNISIKKIKIDLEEIGQFIAPWLCNNQLTVRKKEQIHTIIKQKTIKRIILRSVCGCHSSFINTHWAH